MFTFKNKKKNRWAKLEFIGKICILYGKYGFAGEIWKKK